MAFLIKSAKKSKYHQQQQDKHFVFHNRETYVAINQARHVPGDCHWITVFAVCQLSHIQQFQRSFHDAVFELNICKRN